MSEDEEIVRITHRVPKRVRTAAQKQTEHGELSEMVRELYQSVAYGSGWNKEDSLKLDLERVRAEKDRIRGEISTLQTQLENVERRETRLEERIAQQSEQDKFEGHLESLESLLQNGAHVWNGHAGVETAANAGEVSQQQVIDELQKRNPSVPGEQFEEKDVYGGVR